MNEVRKTAVSSETERDTTGYRLYTIYRYTVIHLAYFIEGKCV